MKKSITVPAAVERLAEVSAFVDAELEQYDCPAKTQYQIDLSVEEIFVNIASYAYPPGSGEAEISFEIRDGAAEITFSDHGRPFDPLAKEDADTSPEALFGREGGLGILMTKKMMDGIRYYYREGRNVLILSKRLTPDM